MFAHRVLVSLLLLATVAPFAGCARKAAAPPPTRVALLTGAAGLEDHSFNAAAAAGLAQCAKETGAQITTVVPKSPADYEAQLALLATQDFDAVIAVGDAMTPALGAVARRFEGTHFAILDGAVDAPNVESLVFNEQDGSFLAGALAALFSRTRQVAFVGGADIPQLESALAGFTGGAREIDPRVRVTSRYLDSFEDAPRAGEAARALFASGSDVIYVVAGKAGLGAIAAARAPGGGYVVGSDANQDGLAPGRILASVVKRVDRAAERVCLEAVGGKPGSGRVELGLANGGVTLSDFAYSRSLVGSATIAHLARLQRAIELGTIRPPSTPDELANFTRDLQ